MTRIEREQQVIALMVRLYCRHHEGHPTLCAQCKELINYAQARLSHCPHGNLKPTCRQCPIHCYNPSMRERMRRVMRYSGPRMILYSPITAITHLLREIRSHH